MGRTHHMFCRRGDPAVLKVLLVATSTAQIQATPKIPSQHREGEEHLVSEPSFQSVSSWVLV